MSVGDSQGNLLIEEELEVSPWRLEDLVTVKLFLFRYQDTASEDWDS
jgi:hypothetical protein